MWLGGISAVSHSASTVHWRAGSSIHVQHIAMLRGLKLFKRVTWPTLLPFPGKFFYLWSEPCHTQLNSTWIYGVSKFIEFEFRVEYRVTRKCNWWNSVRNNFAPYLHIICMLLCIIQLDKFQQSSTRIIDIWNSLPISLINCDTVATFKKHLDCLLKNRGYI